VVQADILRTIGHLPDALMQQVDQALKGIARSPLMDGIRMPAPP
jgi:hypothetical protein